MGKQRVSRETDSYLKGKYMRLKNKRTVILCLLTGLSALLLFGGMYIKNLGPISDGTDAVDMENGKRESGKPENGEPVMDETETETPYEVYISSYTLQTGYVMKVFQVRGMEDKELENKVNESLNSKLYILEDPWFLPENIEENEPVIHLQSDRYLSVEYSFKNTRAEYTRNSSWHHCVTVDMHSGELLYLDDLLNLNKEFAVKVKYNSILHQEGYNLWWDEDNTVLANRSFREKDTDQILRYFEDFTHDYLYGAYYRNRGDDMPYRWDTWLYQTVFYMEEGKLVFTVEDATEIYHVQWILTDENERFLKVPKW